MSRLADGRQLAWSEWGPQDGVPVLLCPGAATGRSLGFGTHVLERLGVRLVSVDRPGLGRSDPAPGRTLTDWADDVRDLSAIRALDGLAVVGFSAGAPFALAVAAEGVATAAATVSGGDELAAPTFETALSSQVRDLVRWVADDPVGAEASFVRFGHAEALWDMISTGLPEVDRAVYLDPAFEAAFLDAMRDALAPGAAGYARDTVLAMSRWSFALSTIAVPVDLWYGQQDTSPVHSPDHGASLATRIPTGRRHVLAEAGGALLWTHAEPILRTLLRNRA